MKVLLDIPDWAIEEGTRLALFAGMELVAYKERSKPSWMVKTSRCCQCGGCCYGFLPPFPYKQLDDGKGTCSKLKKEVGNNPRYLCSADMDKPFICALTPLERRQSIPTCTVEFKAAEE